MACACVRRSSFSNGIESRVSGEASRYHDRALVRRGGRGFAAATEVELERVDLKCAAVQCRCTLGRQSSNCSAADPRAVEPPAAREGHGGRRPEQHHAPAPAAPLRRPSSADINIDRPGEDCARGLRIGCARRAAAAAPGGGQGWSSWSIARFCGQHARGFSRGMLFPLPRPRLSRGKALQACEGARGEGDLFLLAAQAVHPQEGGGRRWREWRKPPSLCLHRWKSSSCEHL